VAYVVDFAAVKAAVPITDALAFLGVNHLAANGETLRGTCPLCQSTNARGFVVTPAKGTWYCFSEKKGGDVIRLTALHGRTDDKGAAQKLAAHFLNGSANGAGKAADNAPGAENGTQARNSAAFNPLDYLKTLDAEHEALAGLDILPETLIAFQAGYSSKGLLRGRMAVAWHNAEGTPIAFIGVALKGELPQYLLPKGQPLPFWFNTHRVEEGEPVRILPGVLDVLQASENGCTNVICPLAPTDADALNSLRALVLEKKVTIEF